MGRRLVVMAAMVFLAAACGSDNGMPPSPPPVAGSTITITSSGVVSPKSLAISPGTQVTFVNNDSRDHEMTSDPHPEHTDCPAINTVDLIVPGHSKQTSNLNTVRTCGYHDHQNPGNAALRGTITIQ